MAAPTELRCNTCGRPASSADRYCGFCGARLDGESATPTAETTGPHRPHVDRILTSLRAATVGEYDVAGEIGRGGMAVVFLAHDLSLNRKVAIKALLPELLYTEGMDRRFKHEARIAAKLDHPNILVIHSVREANDLLYIVMKLVEGLPLSQIVKAAGPLPVPVVRTIVRHVADALAYAHGEGVVHRDVKPANIMVDRRGNVVVMDFGIAKAADDAHLTRTGLVIGTPAYMSPEQCLAQGVSSASDQYSLGVVAYELLTGATPFRGSPLEMQWAHATAAAPSVRSLRPDCPPDLEAVVLRMMAKAPADRWPTLHDVSHALTDEPSVVAAARGALVALVSEVPGRRDPTLPTTPASPVPIGRGPAAIGDATTDPVRATRSREPGTPSSASEAPVTPPNAAPAVAPPVAAPPSAPPLTLSQQQIDLSTGDSVELVVEFEAGEDATDGSSVQWTSSNPSVARVSPGGFVTAVGPGLAEVACVRRGRRAVCVVHVTAAAVAAAMGSTPAPVAAPAVDREGQRAAAAAESDATAAPPQSARVPASTRRPWASSRWLAGVIAAGVIGVLAYRGMRPTSVESTVVGNNPASRAAPATAAPTPPPPASGTAPVAPRPASPSTTAPVPKTAAGSPGVTKPPAPNVTPRGGAGAQTAGTPPATRGAGGTTVAASRAGATQTADSRASAPSTTSSTTAPPPVIPIVPPARPESTRLASRVDSSAGYGSKAAPSSSTPAPAASSPAPAASRDSAADRIPPAPKEIASALFKEFASAINGQSFSRITGAYTQPSDPAAVKLWQEFLVFIRDYKPNAIVRSTSVNDSAYPPTIIATIDFRWAGDSGFERVRSGTFTGIGVPIPGGWQLRRAELGKKFW
jgi:serine/threonine protein kinase